MSRARVVESAYDRHLRLLQEARSYYHRAAPTAPSATTDADVLRAAHSFVRDDTADAAKIAAGDWRTAMAVKYYEKLFKEYALADVSRYKEGKVGMRWRTEAEVLAGTGQFSCGILGCTSRDGLESYELHFSYVEHGQKRETLVKVRACPACAVKLFYGREGKRKRVVPKTTAESDKDDAGGVKGDSGSGATKRARHAAGSKVGAGEGEATGSDHATPVPPPPLAAATAATGSSEWKKPPEAKKTREDEFDDYFRGMFP